MTDRIILTRLAVFAHHGALPQEQQLGQRFLVSVTCETDLAAAGETDDLKQTVSYAAIADLVVSVATQRRFRLIEGLAEAIAAALFAAFPSVQAATIRVEKPGAPIRHMFEMVAVEIERQRHG